MSKNNCYISTNDLFITEVGTAEETIDIFGQDYLDEYGHQLDPTLIERAIKAQKEMREVSRLLKNIKEEQEKNRY